MKKLNQPFRRLLERAQRKFVRSRPGSVLILVVALLILMAIIGTAYMSMAQADRGTAAIHSNNAEIDLLLDGVVNMLRGAVVNDLFAGNGQFRNGKQSITGASGYNNWSGIGLDPASITDPAQNAGNPWTGDRTPDVANRQAGATIRSGGNEPFWPLITAPLATSQFTTPYWNPSAQPFLIGQTTIDPYHYTQRDSIHGEPNRLMPGYITLNGQSYPAWVDNTHADPDANFAILAADTDGDGVADAGYFKLPIGAINGVTYYAAIRIIDNAAAVNANTATWPNATAPGTSTLLVGDYFPTSINLQRMLNAADSPFTQTGNFSLLLKYRMNNSASVLQPIDDLGFSRTDFNFLADPQSASFSVSGLDAFWMQLGRRLDNPAYVAPNLTYQPLTISESILLAHNFILRDPNVAASSVSPSVLDRTLPYTLFNNSSPSPYAANAAFSTAAVWFGHNFTFFNNNTPDMLAPDPSAPGAQTESARALLVARNPVTNFAPNKFNLPISTNGRPNTAPTVGFGDEVQLNGRAYVYIGPPFIGGTTIPLQPLYTGSATAPTFQPVPVLADPALNTSLFWAAEPWADAPTKVSVNTANFGQLYTAYWSAMADYSNRDVNAGVSFLRSDGLYPPAGAAGTEFRQFYNPLRDPTLGTHGPANLPIVDTEARPVGVVGRVTRRWSDSPASGFPVSSQRAGFPTSETIKLRAALAAVNTLALRNPEDPTLPTATVLLSGFIVEPSTTARVPTNIEATVFGSKPQPYIVQVYAENDNQTKPQGALAPNPQGYVGVELYNPYPFPINLTSCQLGIVAGRDLTPAGAGPAYPNMKVLSLTNSSYAFPGITTSAGNIPIVPPFGYLVLENFPNGAAGLSPTSDAVYRPQLVDAPPLPGSLAYYYVPNLSMVMRDPANLAIQPGGELVLLRPRQASFVGGGTMTFTPTVGPGAPVPVYDETQHLYDMAPMDSFDFTGLTLPQPAQPTIMTGIYYHRSNVAGNQPNWKFVYPGRWDSSQPWHGPANDPLYPYRQEGTSYATWDTSSSPAGTDAASFLPNVPVDQPAHWGVFLTQAAPTYLNNFPSIQVASWGGIPGTLVVGMPGPFLIGGASNEFPFTGFPRNGDILQVPYFGAYRLRAIAPYVVGVTTQFPIGHTPDMVLELNPLTLDCQQADDYDSYPPTGTLCDDRVENIGRFCPIDGKDILGAPAVPPPPGTPPTFTIDDYSANPNLASNPPYWRYHWAMQVLDYLTVQSPQDDQFPNAPPEAYLKFAAPNVPVPVVHSTSSSPAAQTYGIVLAGASPSTINANVGLVGGTNNASILYKGARIQFLTGTNAGVITQIAAPGGGTNNQWTLSFPTLPGPPATGDIFVIYGPVEPAASLNGLVNVNSASWRVLAAVPMVPGTTINPSVAGLLNTNIAMSIVRYRDYDDASGAGHGHGPFKNLFELSRVPIYNMTGSFMGYFRDALGAVGPNQTIPFTDLQGDITPYPNPGNANTMGDFEGTYLMMNRVSNLLTTRSDSYTAYILLQGWQDAESANPRLVVQRRAAYIIDRTGISPTNSTPTLTNVPTN